MHRNCIVPLTASTIFLLVLLAGCSAAPASPTRTPRPSTAAPAAATAVRTKRPQSTAQSTAQPSAGPVGTRVRTGSPRPTRTAAPSLSPTTAPSGTPVPSETPTITPTPGPTLFPMLIDAMRQGSYPGSAIKVDEELDPGSNYHRYYVYYLSQDLKIYALLTVPNGVQPAGGWPGIVFDHDYYIPKEYRTGEEFVSYIDRLASSGYVVFAIDYRGHGHSEGTPEGAYGDPGYEVDVLNAVASLKRDAQVNPAKIGMWGQGMGGYLTLRAMVISKDIKAGVIWGGVVAPYADLLSNWPTGPATPPPDSRKWMDDWPTEFAPPQQNPEFWASISANSYMSDLSGPLQLHVGLADSEVPPQFSAALAQDVEAAGGRVEIYAYPDDDHKISNNFTAAMDRSIAFFDTYLKQLVAPAP